MNQRALVGAVCYYKATQRLAKVNSVALSPVCHYCHGDESMPTPNGRLCACGRWIAAPIAAADRVATVAGFIEPGDLLQTEAGLRGVTTVGLKREMILLQFADGGAAFFKIKQPVHLVKAKGTQCQNWN